jgi:hypothetical protein
MRANPRKPLLLASLALGLYFSGCDKKDEKKNQTAPAVSATKDKENKEIAATGALEKLAAPAGIMAFGGADSPEALITSVAAAMGQAGAMLTPQLAAAGLAKDFSLQEGAIDLSKPARFVVADPKTFKEPVLLAFTAKGGREGVEKALPADKKKDDAGNAYSYTAGSKTAYLNFVADWAVISRDKDVFAKNGDFVKQLLGAKTTAPVAAVVSVKNLVDKFGPEIEQGLAKIGQMPAQPGVNPEQLAAMMQGMASMARDADTVVVSASAPDKGFVMTIDARAKTGTDLAKTAESATAGKLALLSKLPKDAAFAFAMSMDTDKVSPLMKSLMQWSMKATFAGAGEKIGALTESFMKACNGEFAFAGYKPSAGEDFAMVSLTGVRDAAAIKKGWQAVYKDPAVAENFKKIGMELTVKPDAYKVGAVSVTTQETKFTGKHPSQAQMQALFGGGINSHYAVSTDLAIVAMAKDPKPVLEAWLGGKVDGGFDQTPGFGKAKGRAADNAFVIGYGSIGGVLSALRIPGAPQLPPGDDGMAFSAGAKDGALRLVIDIPAGQVQQIVALGAGARRQQ